MPMVYSSTTEPRAARSHLRAAGADALAGGLSGLVATVPMSAVIWGLHRLLPARERYPLPPGEITEELAEAAGAGPLPEPARRAATALAHLGFGAAAGAAHALTTARLGPPALAGVLGGLSVWATSYLGWLPVVGLLAPATEHPPRRTAVMVLGHVVWGLTVGWCLAALRGRRGR